ncbi:C-C motif chemokine 3 [Saguinus oedipus]|uniref:C-C motif chemokine 3 n=1 Tax=Saguinus oedipus TaxID=9490 RepID=A0ABQ9VPT6_SAGOE|nr:C-C motif chemokine 3 [Saguinus oedipus]
MTWDLSVPSLAVDTTYNWFYCFSYTSRRVPQKFIVDYFPTNRYCFNPGVVFPTKKGQHFCADPSKEWVKKYIKHLNTSGAAEAVRTQ